MCQFCVDKGIITQSELDNRILSGDTSVMPLMDLSPEQAEDTVIELMREDLARGVPRERVIDLGARTLAAYFEATGRRPS